MARSTPIINLSSSKRMAAALNSLARRAPGRALTAIRDEAEAIMARSKAEFVPVHDGDLHDSGQVRVFRGQGRSDLGQFTAAGIQVELSYGDAKTAPYALAVHEHPSSHSPASWRDGGEVTFSPSGRGPKYLERPLRQAVAGMRQRLAQRLKLSR